MSTTSDGSMLTPQERALIRHHSAGSVSGPEIKNKIAEFNMNKKRNQIKTDINKFEVNNQNIDKDQNKAGDSNINNFNGSLKIQDVTKTVDQCEKDESNSVFKPKHSVNRTPTKMNTQENASDSSNKRPLSESTPESVTNKRRQYDVTDTPINNEQQISVISENIIMDMFSNLDKINEIANKTDTNLTSIDQACLNEVHNNMHKIITFLVFNCGSLEKENLMLKNQLLIKESVLRCDPPKPHKPDNAENIPMRTAYASIVSSQYNGNKLSQDNGNRQTHHNEQWTTPKVTKKHETIIRMENINDSREVLKKLKQEINIKDIGKGFKNIRHTKTGAIVIESFDKNQQEKLKAAVQTKENMNVRESQSTNPMFMITGIEKGFTDEEFLQEIERLNNEIVQELGYNISDKIQVVAKKQCRNPTKENWILQSEPAIAKWFLKRGKIFCDLLTVYVQEHINLALCFKCCGFGHVAKHCSEKECCHKCGKDHKGTECKEENYKCPNCTKLKLEELKHSARDQDCPVYKRRLNTFKNNINYNDFL